MKTTKTFLAELHKRFPVVAPQNHLLMYDSSSDRLVLQLLLNGKYLPMALLEEDLLTEPAFLVDAIAQVLQQQGLLEVSSPDRG
jgi:hypothetical protein